jgi:phosphorylase kinase alpha/beta subunit
MALPIIEKIENELVRENGTIRYHGDQYYNKGSEAQWTLGNLFLGIIYADYNEYDKARYYYDSVMKLCPDGVIPELYHSDGSKGNNKPLGWSVSLAIILAEKLKSIQNNNINIGA